jgi:hypothetical protein
VKKLWEYVIVKLDRENLDSERRDELHLSAMEDLNSLVECVDPCSLEYLRVLSMVVKASRLCGLGYDGYLGLIEKEAVIPGPDPLYEERRMQDERGRMTHYLALRRYRARLTLVDVYSFLGDVEKAVETAELVEDGGDVLMTDAYLALASAQKKRGVDYFATLEKAREHAGVHVYPHASDQAGELVINRKFDRNDIFVLLKILGKEMELGEVPVEYFEELENQIRAGGYYPGHTATLASLYARSGNFEKAMSLVPIVAARRSSSTTISEAYFDILKERISQGGLDDVVFYSNYCSNSLHRLSLLLYGGEVEMVREELERGGCLGLGDYDEAILLSRMGAACFERGDDPILWFVRALEEIDSGGVGVWDLDEKGCALLEIAKSAAESGIDAVEFLSGSLEAFRRAISLLELEDDLSVELDLAGLTFSLEDAHKKILELGCFEVLEAFDEIMNRRFRNELAVGELVDGEAELLFERICAKVEWSKRGHTL